MADSGGRINKQEGMKMKKIRNFLICALLCGCVGLMAACGGGRLSPTDHWWTTTGELVKDEDGNVVFDNVELKLTTVVNGQDKAVFDTLVAMFNLEYEGQIRVISTSVDASVFENTVSNQISNNSNAPDLVMMHQKSMRSFAQYQLIQPFDEAMESSGIAISPDNYAAQISQYMSAGYEDRTFGIPVDAQSFAVFYNKEVLAKYSDTVPASRSELLEVCRKFTADSSNNGRRPIAWATGTNYFIEYVFPTAVLQNGGSFYDADSMRTNWYDDEENRAAYTAAIESIRELIDLGYAAYGEANSNALSQFISGERLFYFATPWSMQDLIGNYARTMGVTQAELIENVLGGASMAGWFAMSDNPAKNSIYGDSHFFTMTKTVSDINEKAAMLEFARWFTSEASVGVEWAKAGHVSVSNAITASEEYQIEMYVSEYIGKFYGDIDNFNCIGTTPHYDTIITNLCGLFTDTVDDTSVEIAPRIKQRQDDANTVIDFANMGV